MKKESFASRARDARFIELSEKNKKLVPNSETKFLIWNLPAIVTCPHATANCKKFCYAIKAETAYPTCKPCRDRHFEISRRADFADRMIYSIESYLIKPSYKAAKKIIVRIHESGDFYNAAYMGAWFDIAKHFKGDKRVVFMAYTKSMPYVDTLAKAGRDIPHNMVMRFSIWDDTPREFIALAAAYDMPIYTAVDRFTADIKPQNRCRCKDCATCGKCWNRTKTLVCEIH